jgi:HEPN domain-containing protein
MDSNNFNKEKVINYWIESAQRDFKTMNNLFKSNDFHWALFIGHLVIEKLLKALYIKKKNAQPMFTHDLLRLAKKIGLELTETEINMMDTITTFNINARYDNYKYNFYKICTKEFTEEWIKNISKLKKWLEEKF